MDRHRKPMTKEQAEEFLKQINNAWHGRTPEAMKRKAAIAKEAQARAQARAARAEAKAEAKAARNSTRKAQNNGNGAAPNRRRTWKNYFSCTGPGCGANAPTEVSIPRDSAVSLRNVEYDLKKALGKQARVSSILSRKFSDVPTDEATDEVTDEEALKALEEAEEALHQPPEHTGGKRKRRRTLKNKRK